MGHHKAVISTLLATCAWVGAAYPASAGTPLSIAAGRAKLHLLGEAGGDEVKALRAAIAQASSTSGSPAWASQLQGLLRSGGYPFARVVAQRGGAPTLVAFGELDGLPRFDIASKLDAARLQALYQRAICPQQPDSGGCVVRSHNLERATALLSLQPEVKDVSLEVDPEATDPNGKIALTVKVKGHERPVQVSVTADNSGTPSLGHMQTGLAISAPNLVPGGSVTAEITASNRKDFTGAASWTQGIGDRGVQTIAQVSRTTYSMVLPAPTNPTLNGRVMSASIGLSYPVAMNFDRILKMQADAGMILSKVAVDAVGTLQQRRIPYLDLTLSGGSGLRALGAGRNYAQGSVTLRLGKPSDSAQSAAAQDAAGPQELGNFARLGAQLVAHHDLGLSPWAAGIELRGQWASRNLDPSQQLGVGGPDGVRAYRADEGGLDTGALVNLSLSRALPPLGTVQLVPQAFLDYAVGREHYSTWAGWNNGSPGLSNTRRLGAIGLGVDASAGKLNASLSVARQLPGVNVSVADPTSKTQVWASAQLLF